MRVPKNERKSFRIGEAQTIKTYANNEEKRVAKELNQALQQPNSGATTFMKADIRLGEYVLDVKSTQGGQIIVTEKMISKVESDAIRASKRPAIILNFSHSDKVRNKKWLLIPMRDV